MKWLSFFGLSGADKLLFLKVAFLLAATRTGLSLLPYRIIRRRFERYSSGGIPIPEPGNANRSRGDDVYAERVVFLARAAGRRLLGTRPCLPQALVVEGLLRRRGVDAALRIGVKKGIDGDLQAHAWVETNGDVIIGGRIHSRRYARLRPAGNEAT